MAREHVVAWFAFTGPVLYMLAVSNYLDFQGGAGQGVAMCPQKQSVRVRRENATPNHTYPLAS